MGSKWAWASQKASSSMGTTYKIFKTRKRESEGKKKKKERKKIYIMIHIDVPTCVGKE